MKYSKPEVTAVIPAVRAIQGGDPKNVQMYKDNTPPHLDDATIFAYEADE
jgi:hypothetical protein